MSAQVTEAHRATAETIFKLAEKAAHNGDPFREPCAQLIADSEAKATAELRGALAFGQQNCDDVYDDLRTERDAAIARAERAEAELKEARRIVTEQSNLRLIAEDALNHVTGLKNKIHERYQSDLAIKGAELAHERETSRLLTVAMNVRDEGYTEMRKLLSKVETELATERARMADLVADLNDACITLESAENDCDDYAMQNTAFKLMAVRAVLLQYIPNAAMKEGGK